MRISVSSFMLLATTALINATPSSDISESTSLGQPQRIVNGDEVDITKIPYHAGLRRKVSGGWAYSCGGAIIATNAVVTAAHCVLNYQHQPSNLRITVGTSYRLSGGKTYDLTRVIVHEAYDEEWMVNDIAILVTIKEIAFSASVSPVAIAPPDLNLSDGTEALVSGFGLTEHEGSPSPILLAATVYVVNQDVCARAYLRITSISSGMICAHAYNPPRDACQGDSGGPLVADGMLIGIVSWGEGCAERLYPGVYTRVSEYHGWISENLKSISG